MLEKAEFCRSIGRSSKPEHARPRRARGCARSVDGVDGVGEPRTPRVCSWPSAECCACRAPARQTRSALTHVSVQGLVVDRARGSGSAGLRVASSERLARSRRGTTSSHLDASAGERARETSVSGRRRCCTCAGLRPPTPTEVQRLRGGADIARGLSFVVSKILASMLPMLMSLACTSAAGGHSHGHEGHAHVHDHGNSDESHAHAHSHGHEHGHAHTHSHSPVRGPHQSGASSAAMQAGSAAWNYLSALTVQHPSTSAIIACGFVSCSALFVMPFLPFLNNDGNDSVSVHNSLLLKVLISFAVGGLLGDVFLHMLPHMISRTFASKRHEDEVSQALNFGCPILGGMLIFYLAEKIMAAVSEDSSGHCSEHGHTRAAHGCHSTADCSDKAKSRGEADSDAAREKSVLRGAQGSKSAHEGSILDLPPERTISGFRQHVWHFEHSSFANICRRCQSLLGLTTGLLPDHWVKSWQSTSPSVIRPAAYLNLLADLLHNFSDGLALGVSFGKGHGLSTTMAVFFHEVPHNVADFAILISNGFSRVGALQAQWASAVGALLGTLAGLRLHSIQGMQVALGTLSVPTCVCVSLSVCVYLCGSAAVRD